jgi:phosphoglycolate phosphatase
MSLTPKKSIIFDMDGTILDSSFAMLQSVNYVRDWLGLEPLSKEYLEYHINALDQDLPMLFYQTEKYDPKHRALFKEHYLSNANLHVKPYKGAKECLEILKQKGIKLTVATNASDFFALNMLKHQKLLDYFDLVIGANCVAKPKPDPDMVYYIAQKMQIPLGQTLLVGDSIKDELAAENADIDFLFATWGYGQNHKQVQKIDSLKDIVDFV